MNVQFDLAVYCPHNSSGFELGKLRDDDGEAQLKSFCDFLWPLRNLQKVQRAEDPEGGGGSGGAYGSECIWVHDFKP